MGAPDPEAFSMASKVIAACTAVAAPITWLWAKLDKKADKKTVEASFVEVNKELTLHRGYFKDVFEQMRQNEQRAQDRHERLMERLAK